MENDLRRWMRLIEQDAALIKAAHLVRQAIQQPRPKLVLRSGHNAVMLSKSLDPDFKFRLTVFDDNIPTGHVEYGDDEEAIHAMATDLADIIRDQADE